MIVPLVFVGNSSIADIQLQLSEGAAALGVELSAEQLGQFARYAELLDEWNQRVNLTRIPSDQVVQLQFLDSLAVFRAVDVPSANSLIDVGTGAGLPGMALKIAAPHLTVTLLDSTRKRLAFLDHVIAALKLHGVSTLHARAEDAGHDARYRERFDLVTARAVARLAALAELTLPFAQVGGGAVALKSAAVAEELAEAVAAIRRLGGRPERVAEVTLPGTEMERRLVVLRKERPTPARYPRRPAEIKALPAT